MGAPFAGPGDAGESYVAFGPAAACLWDCGGDNDGNVGFTDFMVLRAQWDSLTTCDLDGGGVGITDFPALLANWGPCP